MEKLSEVISKSYESNKVDRLDELKLEIFKNKIENQLMSEAINFSNLDFSKLIILFDNNEKLLTDYFRFSLYQILSGSNLELFFTSYAVPFAYMQKIVEFVLESQNKKLLEIFIHKNYTNFSEENILFLLRSILDIERDSKNDDEEHLPETRFEEYEERYKIYNNHSTYLTSLLMKVNIDKNYFLNLMKNKKELRLLPKQAINLYYIIGVILKKSYQVSGTNNTSASDISSISNYFSIASDLLLIIYINKKINEDSFKTIMEDGDKIKIEINKIKNSLHKHQQHSLPNYKPLSSILQSDFLIENIKI